MTLWVSGREAHCLTDDGLVLDGGQPPQAVLAAPAVVGALDPGHDRDAQLFAGGPGAAVQDVLLQQREERFHSRVIPALTG